MDEQRGYVHATDYYSAIKRNEGLKHVLLCSGVNPPNFLLIGANRGCVGFVCFVDFEGKAGSLLW